MLRQTSESFPEIDSPGMRFIARLFRLRDVIFENAQREMAEFELSPAEYSVLATLRKTPAPHRLKPSDIYKGMLLSSGGLSKVLKTLEERGLVLREDDQDDTDASADESVLGDMSGDDESSAQARSQPLSASARR